MLSSFRKGWIVWCALRNARSGRAPLGDGWSEDGRGFTMTGPILRKIIAITEKMMITQ